MFTFAKCPLSISGKSSRAWPPRLSLRASAARAIASLTMSMLRMSNAWCHAGVVVAVAVDLHARRRLADALEVLEALLQVLLVADDADVASASCP